MTTAQERFSRMLKGRWGPTLRGLGFSGSGKIWTRPDDADWIMLGFQTSRSSDAGRSKFTINLLVVGKDQWEEARESRPYLSTRPNPNAGAAHRFWQRSGLLTHGHDHWWVLTDDEANENAVGDEVDRALRDVLVPALLRASEEFPGEDPRSRDSAATP